MKRLAIFSFFDEEGIVDSYIDYLLSEICQIASCLIIVVNGRVTLNGYKLLKKHSNNIIIRKNKGFDAGAYADIIVNQIGKEALKNWDEIVFSNNTYYGPFIPLKFIFESMDKKSNDFWGLVQNKDKIFTFIHSYFFVLRNKIIDSGKVYDFFHDYINTEETDLLNVCAVFEHGLFQFLLDKGYHYDSYTNIENLNIYYSADICIKDYNVPILKKKTFSNKYFDKTRQKWILHYLKCHTCYDIDLILQNSNRQYHYDFNKESELSKPIPLSEAARKKTLAASVARNDLISFLKKNKNVYFFGAGAMARIVYVQYKNYIQGFQGFLVSKGQHNIPDKVFGFPVSIYSNVTTDITLVVTLNEDNTQNVRSQLLNDKHIKKILFLNDENSG